MKLEEMALFFENRLSGYDEHMLCAIEGATEFYPFTAAQLPRFEHCKILDLGCGTGLELEAYFPLNPSADITGIDLSEGMLAALQKKFPDKALRLICGSYFDVDFGADTFDAAVSVESLHHFSAERKRSLYQKLFAALKSGGYLILTDYFAKNAALEREYFENLRNLQREQGISGNKFYHYDTPLMVEHETDVLQSAGFTDVKILKNWGATYTLKATK